MSRGVVVGGAVAAAVLGFALAPSFDAPPAPADLLDREPPAAGASLVPVSATVLPAAASPERRSRIALMAAPRETGPVPTLPALTKAAQVQGFVASGRPADAFEAYRILSLCAVVQALQEAQDHLGSGPQQVDHSRLAEQCGDLSPGQISGRVQLLEVAAAAHVPGAVAALMNQGPDGQPVSEVWDDPAFADWKRTTLERLETEADRGDAVALQMMVSRHDRGDEPLSPQDGAAALQYYTAFVDVELATDPVYASPTRRESLQMQAQRLVSLYASALSPDQADAAIAAGHALVSSVVASAAAPGP